MSSSLSSSPRPSRARVILIQLPKSQSNEPEANLIQRFSPTRELADPAHEIGRPRERFSLFRHPFVQPRRNRALSHSSTERRSRVTFSHHYLIPRIWCLYFVLAQNHNTSSLCIIYRSDTLLRHPNSIYSAHQTSHLPHSEHSTIESHPITTHSPSLGTLHHQPGLQLHPVLLPLVLHHDGRSPLLPLGLRRPEPKRPNLLLSSRTLVQRPNLRITIIFSKPAIRPEPANDPPPSTSQALRLRRRHLSLPPKLQPGSRSCQTGSDGCADAGSGGRRHLQLVDGFRSSTWF